MKLTEIEQIKALRFLNNLDVVEKSLQQEFELGRIDAPGLENLLRGISEQRKHFHKVIDELSVNSKYQ